MRNIDCQIFPRVHFYYLLNGAHLSVGGRMNGYKNMWPCEKVTKIPTYTPMYNIPTLKI